MIFYFTGTGNSLWTATEISRQLGETAESIIHYRNELQIKPSDSRIGIVVPTYMGDLPWIVKDFMLKLKIERNCYAFLVMTSNLGKSGNAFLNADRALKNAGGYLSAGFDLQMPGNC